MTGFLFNKIIAVFLVLGSVLALANANAVGPLRVEVEPVSRIYSSQEGLEMKFVFKATENVRLCVEKDFLTQMQLKISRSGVGLLPLQPLVTVNNREMYRQRVRIYRLKSGETLTLRANLKRFRFAEGYRWEPAEYTVNGAFNLCSQTGGEEYSPMEEEQAIPFEKPGWFMIMS